MCLRFTTPAQLKVPRHCSGLEAETMAGFLLLEGRTYLLAMGGVVAREWVFIVRLPISSLGSSPLDFYFDRVVAGVRIDQIKILRRGA